MRNRAGRLHRVRLAKGEEDRGLTHRMMEKMICAL